MNDIATDFRESARIDVNDVLDNIREDIQIITDEIDDLKVGLAMLSKAVKDLADVMIRFVGEDASGN